VLIFGSHHFETVYQKAVSRVDDPPPVILNGLCENVEEIDCNKWKKTLSYLLVLPGLRARIVQCGGRYDPLLVKCSSE